jgi:hypothetical protein
LQKPVMTGICEDANVRRRNFIVRQSSKCQKCCWLQ